MDEYGDIYYVDHNTGTTTWADPRKPISSDSVVTVAHPSPLMINKGRAGLSRERAAVPSPPPAYHDGRARATVGHTSALSSSAQDEQCGAAFVTGTGAHAAGKRAPSDAATMCADTTTPNTMGALAALANPVGHTQSRAHVAALHRSKAHTGVLSPSEPSTADSGPVSSVVGHTILDIDMMGEGELGRSGSFFSPCVSPSNAFSARPLSPKRATTGSWWGARSGLGEEGAKTHHTLTGAQLSTSASPAQFGATYAALAPPSRALPLQGDGPLAHPAPALSPLIAHQQKSRSAAAARVAHPSRGAASMGPRECSERGGAGGYGSAALSWAAWGLKAMQLV